MSSGAEGVQDHVEFLGRISDSDKAGFYKSLSVYVAPQTGGESFGIVLAEAMAAGCPLVASDLQAFKDVSCNGACAELFPSSDPGKLAEAVCTVLKDDARRSSMVRAGMARSDDFDWATVTDDILSLFMMALPVPGRRPAHPYCASVCRCESIESLRLKTQHITVRRNMSGHSKWATTKNKKAAIDAKRGKLFAKLIKNIEIAARLAAGTLTGILHCMMRSLRRRRVLYQLTTLPVQ